MVEFQPYIGPRPFERQDAARGRFFGRDAEASDLLSLVIAHPALLFYSPSGTGKTSLLNAALIPMLEGEGLKVLTPGRVRSVASADVGPGPPDTNPDAIKNIYTFNALRSWDNSRTESGLLAKMSMTDYMKACELPISGTHGQNRRVAVFDQIEEIFTFYSDRWEDREDFFGQVGDALGEDPLMRVLFIIREDYIAELDPFLHLLPEGLRTHYRMERLSEQKALDAVTGPLRGSNYSFAEGVAEQLVGDLLTISVYTGAGLRKTKSEFVDPMQLQVTCQTLWENCEISWSDLEPTAKVITQEQLLAFGDVDQALCAFYEHTLEKVLRSTGVKEGRLRDWFDTKLITPVGTRGTVYRGLEDSGGIPAAAVDEVIGHHLIVSGIRGGAKWVELAHDRLIGPIRTSNDAWRQRHAGQEGIGKRLEAGATSWVLAGRKSSALLDEVELLEAQRWLESPYVADVGCSESTLALVHASEAVIEAAARKRQEALSEERRQLIENQAKANRRLTLVTAILAMMVVLALSAAWFALRQDRLRANADRLRADADRKRTQQLQSETDDNDSISTAEIKALEYLENKEPSEALKTYQALASLFGQMGVRDRKAKMLVAIAGVLERQGNVPEAIDRLNEAASIYHALGQTENEAGVRQRIETYRKKPRVISDQ